MTRRTRRELESAVDDLADGDGEGDRHAAGPPRTVYRDPVTYKLYDGYGEDAAPIEDLAEDVRLIISSRTLSMSRERAEREGREILDVINEHPEVVSVRIEPADDVATEDAVVRPPADNPTILADFTGVDT